MKVRLFGAFLLTVLLVTGCKNVSGIVTRDVAREGAEVAPSLVREVAGSVGASSREVRLSEAELRTLAGQVEVPPHRLRTAMATADHEPVWERSLRTVNSLDGQTKGTIRSVMVDTACDVLQGEIITYRDFFARLGESTLSNLTPSVRLQLMDVTQSLIDDLQAAAEGDDETRATVAILCHTASTVGMTSTLLRR